METNTKKDDDRLIKFVIFIVLITMIAMILVSSTYSKYTSSASGTDEATVAKWSFEVNDTEIAVAGNNETVTFGLFDTIYDTDGTNAEGDVASGKIAPGTSGKFDLKLENTSEVTAQYGIDFTVTNASNIPIQYSLDGTNWSSELADITASDDTKLVAGSGTKTQTVYWKWVFETVDTTDNSVTAGDNTDTNLGIAAQTTAPTITVEASVTATQVD